MNKILIIFILMLNNLTPNGIQTPEDTLNRGLKTIELNHGWQFRQADSTKWFKATVPGSIHTDLLDNSIIKDPFYRTNEKDLQWIDKYDWEYQTSFEADSYLLEYSNVELVFSGLDTYADVYLNDEKIISADNMFRRWISDCRKYLRPGLNSLRVYFHSPVKIDLPKLHRLNYSLPASNDQSENGGLGSSRISVFARKAPYHYGWDWGPRFVTSGIWRPVSLIAWNKCRFESVRIIQNNISPENADITVSAEILSAVDDTIRIQIFKGKELLAEQPLQLKKGINQAELPFQIKSPKLWWPNGLGEQPLYEISTRLLSNSELLDVNITNIGIRQLELLREKDSHGTSFYFRVNGRPVFMKGANYIPSDVFLNRVSADDYENLIRSASDANMNMLRVWGGGVYEKDLFYNLCDKYGILVWQDFMFACSMYPGDKAFLENVRLEAIYNIKRLRNHPSLALWCGNNEIEDAWNYWGWQFRLSRRERKEIYSAYQAIFLDLLPSAVKEYDGTRYYWPSSPGSDFGKPSKAGSGDMHYWGVWHGKEPFENFDRKIGRFMSEYGFQSFPELSTIETYTLPEDRNIESPVMAHHQRSGIGNLRIRDYLKMYYRMPKDFESFLYTGQVLQAYGIKKAIEAHRRNMPYCMGSLYWQLNDCWPVASWSGIDYYKKWKALHYHARHAFEALHAAPILRNGAVDFFVISDLKDDLEAVMKIEVIDFSGKEFFSRTLPIYIVNNSSRSYHIVSRKELTSNQESRNLVLAVRIFKDNKTISENYLYFNEPKELNLLIPDIQVKIEKTREGLRLEITSDVLAKNVYLRLDGADTEETDTHFSDNYFDLLPGRRITVEAKTNLDTGDFLNKLRIMSLYDSYSKK